VLDPGRVEVQIPDQFEQVVILVAEDGLLSSLKEMPDLLVALVVEPGVGAKEALHDP
jgi:hypothetical protein